jgi:hypothetical protein
MTNLSENILIVQIKKIHMVMMMFFHIKTSLCKVNGSKILNAKNIN